MDSMNVTELRKRVADVVSRVAYGKERVAIAKHGRRVAVIIPAEDADYLEQLEDELDAREAGEALEEFHRSGEKAIPWKDVKKQLACKDRKRRK